MAFKWNIQVIKYSIEINKKEFKPNWDVNLRNDYYVERSMQTFRITPKEKIVLTPWFEGEIYKAECIEVKGEFLVRKFQILFNLSWFLFLIGFFIRSAMGYMGPSLIAMSGIVLVGFLIQLKFILDLFSGIKEFEKRLKSSFISNDSPSMN